MSTKEQILAILLDSPDEAVSGERLARRLGVSRTAVWKGIEALRLEGYTVDAVTNRGYLLRGEREILSAAGIKKHLRTETFGKNCEVSPVISSTNNRARELAVSGAPEGTLVAARAQTEGRGRLGRKFHSPADSGIYLSIVLRPTLPAAQAVNLTLMCAVAVCRAIERLTDLKPGIKWVNDIFINGKKVCGILCEADVELETGRMAYAVAGIGINVSPMEFPEELKRIATSIGNECGKDISKNRLAAEICGCLEEIVRGGHYMDEYRARSVATGKKVKVRDGDTEYTALVKEIDASGGLVVSTQYGERTLRSGEISIIMEEQTV